MRNPLLFSLALLGSSAAQAAELDLGLELPAPAGAEYHRPYVAVWLETPDQVHVADLAVWYDLAKPDHQGEKWLKDLRQWWRRSGRDLDLPVDGLSAATRPAGTHHLHYSSQKAPLRDLKAGQYRVVVEAARENGGRELVRLPLSWPPASPEHQQIQGQAELGLVSLQTTP